MWREQHEDSKQRWRASRYRCTEKLKVPVLRWPVVVYDTYHWRDGVGPKDKRRPC
jgi:alpha-L-arabinofuranosidase